MSAIAILDDNDEFCLVIKCLLSDDFEVSTFTETTRFLKKVETERYDLVLVDLSITPFNSEIQDGCDLIGYLKKNLKEPPLLILFTGWIGKNALEEGQSLCPLADGFLAKGSDIDEILLEINRLLNSKLCKN